MSSKESAALVAAYYEAFGVMPPEPFGIDQEVVDRKIRDALEEAVPLPPDYDFHDGIPDDAVA